MFRSYYADKYKKLKISAISTWKAENKDKELTHEILAEIIKSLPCANQLKLKPRKFESIQTYFEWDQSTEKLEPIEKDMEYEINYYKDSYDFKKFFKQTGQFMQNCPDAIYGDFRVQQNSTLGDFHNAENVIQEQIDLLDSQQGHGVDESKVDTPPTPPTPPTPESNENGDNNGK